MPNDFDKISEFTLRFEQGHFYENFGLTGHRQKTDAQGKPEVDSNNNPVIEDTKFFVDGKGNKVAEPRSADEATAKDFYKKYIFSKQDGYDLEGIPVPMAAMGFDIAVNQFDVDGAFLLAANKRGAHIKGLTKDTQGNAVDFSLTERTDLWFGNAQKGIKGVKDDVENGTTAYRDTKAAQLYQQNKQTVIDAYNADPDAFLKALTETRMEMYSRTPNREKLRPKVKQYYFAEWSERAFADYDASKALLNDPNYPVGNIGANYANNLQYRKEGSIYAASINNAENSRDDKSWYDSVDMSVNNMLAGKQPVVPSGPVPAVPADSTKDTGATKLDELADMAKTLSSKSQSNLQSSLQDMNKLMTLENGREFVAVDANGNQVDNRAAVVNDLEAMVNHLRVKEGLAPADPKGLEAFETLGNKGTLNKDEFGPGGFANQAITNLQNLETYIQGIKSGPMSADDKKKLDDQILTAVQSYKSLAKGEFQYAAENLMALYPNDNAIKASITDIAGPNGVADALADARKVATLAPGTTDCNGRIVERDKLGEDFDKKLDDALTRTAQVVTGGIDADHPVNSGTTNPKPNVNIPYPGSRH